jgi:hypothetical protein
MIQHRPTSARSARQNINILADSIALLPLPYI